MTRQENVLQRYDKQTAIDTITTFKTRNNKRIDIGRFSNLLVDPVRQEGIEQYEGYYLAKNILKQELGLSAGGAKASLDIVFIPYGRDTIFYDRTAVFEIRVASADFDDPDKWNASCGYTGVDQLIKDGFPLIGLYHICMPRLMSQEQMSGLKYFNGQPGEKREGWFNFLIGPHDWMDFETIDKRMQGLIRSGLPKYVSVDSFALLSARDNKWSEMTSMQYRGFTSGYFSPLAKKATIMAIEAHFLKYGEERYRKLPVFAP